MAAEKLDLDEIQGNILAGFKNTYITFLSLKLSDDADEARAWLADVIADVATTTEVKTFNDFFRLARGSGAEDPTAAWMNLGLTHTGLQALGLDDAELGQLPAEFRRGMRARARRIGDTGPDRPAKWPDDLGSKRVDALMIVADDDGARLNARVDDFGARALARGATEVFRVVGQRRERINREFEHFGYRDGISQPAVKGYTQNQEGLQEPIKAGEFVFGYEGEPTAPGSRALDPRNPQPAWLKNGSFLVFRRLKQNVPGFHKFVGDAAPAANMSPDVFRAKLVGRFPSGARLVDTNRHGDDPGLDPGALKAEKTNDVKYSDDIDGMVVPRAAHIRKANPRDQLPDDEMRRRRILRRGIPYGREHKSDRRPDTAYGDDVDRGLCFVCYQRSIADQFEHIQRKWMIKDSYPQEKDGVDPLSSRSWRRDSRYCAVPGARGTPIQLGKMWVTTTGGEYFFAPSIAAMKHFAHVGRTPT